MGDEAGSGDRSGDGAPGLVRRVLAAPGVRGWVLGCILVVGCVVGAAVFEAGWVLFRPASFQAFRWERQRIDGWSETLTYAVQVEGYGAERVTFFDSQSCVFDLFINWAGPIPSWPSVYSLDVEYRELHDGYLFVSSRSSSKRSNQFDTMSVKVGARSAWLELGYSVSGVAGGYVPPMPSFTVAPITLIGTWWRPTWCVVRWRAIAMELLVPVAAWTILYLGLRAGLLWRRSRRGLCWRCAYPAPASSRCPECGSMV